MHVLVLFARRGNSVIGAKRPKVQAGCSVAFSTSSRKSAAEHGFSTHRGTPFSRKARAFASVTPPVIITTRPLRTRRGDVDLHDHHHPRGLLGIVLFQSDEQLDAGHQRHAHVAQDQVEAAPGLELRERGLAAVGDGHLVLAQQPRHHGADHRLVIDDQHARFLGGVGHGVTMMITAPGRVESEVPRCTDKCQSACWTMVQVPVPR